MFKKGFDKKDTYKIMFCILFCFLLITSGTSSAQLFSGTHDISTVIDETSSAVFIGDISFQGSFQGISLEIFIDSFSDYLDLLDSSVFPEDLQYFSGWNEVYGFPTFSETLIEDVNVYEINTTEISNLDDGSLGSILSIAQSILSYDQVDIKITSGVALIGSDQQDYSVNHESFYGIGGLFQLELSDDFPASGLGVLSNQRSVIRPNSEGLFLYPLESIVTIVEDEEVIRTIDQTDIILLIKTSKDDIVKQDSIFHFFPLLTDQEANAMFSVMVSESDSADDNLMSLLLKMNESFSILGENPIQDFLSFNDGLHSIIPLVSQVLNSGFILINTSQPISINDNIASDITIAASRGPMYSMQVDQQSSSPVTITGSSSLLFINDHLYTEAAESSDNGVSFPLWSIFLWILAIGSIIFYIFLKKNQMNSYLTDATQADFLRNPFIRLLFPISVLLVFFFLIDLTFSSRIGLSFLGLLYMDASAMVLGLFLLIELIVLLIMFLMYALPTRLVHDMLCKTLIDNKYQRVSRMFVMIIVFWIGIQLYVLVLFNIILSFLPISSMIPVG